MSLVQTINRPLVFLDLETTSARVHEARIVEISLAFFGPGESSPEVKTRRVNPGVPIPPEATEVHGITDEDVAGEPTFDRFASSLLLQLDECDLAGFNIRRYDLPVLEAEFNRCGMSLHAEDRLLLDSMVVFHRQEPRDLAGAVQFYLDRDHRGAHTAAADTLAAAEVLFAQLERYRGAIPQEPQALHAWMDESHPYETAADQWFDRTPEKPVDYVFKRGKWADSTLGWVAANENGYLYWMLFKAEDMAPAVKDIIRPFYRS